MPLGDFYQQVYRVVRLIPKGRVMSYGGVARQCGRPGLARTVGYALHDLPAGTNVPWWRVVNSAGRISIGIPGGAQEQKDRLIAESVEVSDDLRLDIRRYDAELIVYRKLRRASSVKRKC